MILKMELLLAGTLFLGCSDIHKGADYTKRKKECVQKNMTVLSIYSQSLEPSDRNSSLLLLGADVEVRCRRNARGVFVSIPNTGSESNHGTGDSDGFQ